MGTKANINKISPDENGFTAFIIAGRLSMIERTVKENESFIQSSKSNLEKITSVLGAEIVEELTPANISRMMLMHVRNLKNSGVISVHKSEKEMLLKLMTTVGPIREMIKEKTESNKRFKRKMEDGVEQDAEINIRAPLEAPIEISFGGATDKIMPEDGAVNITGNNGELVKKPLII